MWKRRMSLPEKLIMKLLSIVTLELSVEQRVQLDGRRKREIEEEKRQRGTMRRKNGTRKGDREK